MHNTRYVLIFTLIMTSVVALSLSGLFYATEGKAKQNEAVFNKRAVLRAVNDYLDKSVEELTDEEVLQIFDEKMDQQVLNMNGEIVDAEAVKSAGYVGGRAEDIDMAKEKKKPEANRILPLFTFKSPDGDILIVTIRGNGLWDEIWGNIAIKIDKENGPLVVGAAFDHKGETPGLGAEIKDNPNFRTQFKNKKLFRDGDYVSVDVRKGGAKDKDYEVDGISGATVTADGVSEMLYRGIGYYLPYIDEMVDGKKKG